MPLKLNKQQRSQILPLLNDRQRNKYNRRTDPSLKEHYLAGRYFLYALLARYLNTHISNIDLAYSRFKKPYLNSHTQSLQFNYTDTNGYGLFAFSQSVELGIDVEQRSRTGNFAAIAQKRFTNDESTYVTNELGQIHSQRFLAYWTRKEAYGKALGVGVNFQMNQIDLHSEGPTKQLTNPDWTMIQLDLPDQHIGCVVYQGHETMTITPLSLKPE